MIGINMDMPDTCEECPCSHMISEGRLKGLMMCNVLEYVAENKKDKTRFLVDELTPYRPQWCPMMEIPRLRLIRSQ